MDQLTRRGFALAGASAATLAGAAPKGLAPLSPGIKISMQVGETVTDEDLTWIKQMGVDYLNVQTGKGRATLDNFLAIRKRVEAAGLQGLEHLQQRQSQHRGDHAQPAGPRRRRSPGSSSTSATPARPASATSPTPTWPTASGQPAGDDPRRRRGPRLQPGDGQGHLERQDLRGRADPRPQVLQGRALGELHLLHQADRAGCRGSRRAHRHPSRRPAGA